MMYLKEALANNVHQLLSKNYLLTVGITRLTSINS